MGADGSIIAGGRGGTAQLANPIAMTPAKVSFAFI
jgi:hypothetical protein